MIYILDQYYWRQVYWHYVLVLWWSYVQYLRHCRVKLFLHEVPCVRAWMEWLILSNRDPINACMERLFYCFVGRLCNVFYLIYYSDAVWSILSFMCYLFIYNRSIYHFHNIHYIMNFLIISKKGFANKKTKNKKGYLSIVKFTLLWVILASSHGEELVPHISRGSITSWYVTF